ncbi:FtsB family cell division protein [Paenibacillus sp. FSL H8-0034]|uniref:FtsB family cell division protein n=1 Tax=Paenibacillus sp. FSL H8-0034 TaxID=2954671 RepID=UPI0030FCB647
MRAVSITSNNTKPNNKGSFRRRRLVLIVLACFMSWAGVTLWNQVSKLGAKDERMSALQQELDENRKINEATKREIVRLNDPEYVEQKIRKELHYVKQGETLFYVPKELKK